MAVVYIGSDTLTGFPYTTLLDATPARALRSGLGASQLARFGFDRFPPSPCQVIDAWMPWSTGRFSNRCSGGTTMTHGSSGPVAPGLTNRQIPGETANGQSRMAGEGGPPKASTEASATSSMMTASTSRPLNKSGSKIPGRRTCPVVRPARSGRGLHASAPSTRTEAGRPAIRFRSAIRTSTAAIERGRSQCN